MITDINLRHEILLTILTTTLREFEEKKLEINSGGGGRGESKFDLREPGEKYCAIQIQHDSSRK